MDAKLGDLVHIRGKIIAVEKTKSATCPYRVAFGDGSRGLWFGLSDIIYVEPSPIAVGDTVRHTDASENVFGLPAVEPHLARMHVNAIVDGRAWCRSGGYDYILEVEKLERVFTSFPYLTLSRRLGVRYGDVLKVVDRLDRVYGSSGCGPSSWIPSFAPSNSPLDSIDTDMVINVWGYEQERRRRVLSVS